MELRPPVVARGIKGKRKRGIKGKGPCLTFDLLGLLSDFVRKQKIAELTKYTTSTLKTHNNTIADLVTLL